MASAIRRAGTDQTGSELVEIGLTDRHCAGIDQPFNDISRGFGDVSEIRTRTTRRNTSEIDIVFDRERNAEKWEFIESRGIECIDVFPDFLRSQQSDPH